MTKVRQALKDWNRRRIARRRGTQPQGQQPLAKRLKAHLRKIFLKTRGRDHDAARAQMLRGHLPGPHFEEALVGSEVLARQASARLFAFYLPQFYPFEENDRWWGTGFTEWRNVTRGMPRFEGHLQPRLPRDLGFYDLRSVDVIKKQVGMARASGVAGFCFYYYWFDGKRLLDAPLDLFLEHGEIDFPFSLMWANENWTRRWDGYENDVLIAQHYREQDDIPLVDDLARYFKDPRYERVDGRPLFMFYRPGIIQGFSQHLARWRILFEERHGLQPLFLMAQVFGDHDPTKYGLDGAIEFPPHKLGDRLPRIKRELKMLDASFAGTLVRYDDLVAKSLAVTRPTFELIRTLVPAWDNEARKPGRGLGLVGSEPQKYGAWLEELARQANERPFLGKVPYVFVNAWNEWAEGAFLEPDLHHGSAYLNATFRALTGIRAAVRTGSSILLVGHDAHPHGAQLLLLNMMKTLKHDFGVEPTLLLLKGGALVPRYAEWGEVIVLSDQKRSHETVVSEVSQRITTHCAICNTVATGKLAELLVRKGFRVVSLVHELASLIQSYKLEDHARAIVKNAHCVVFPGAIVQQAFSSVSGVSDFNAVMRPQGIYQNVSHQPERRLELRQKLGIAPSSRVVLNMGFGDLRKGFDLFVALARQVLRDAPDCHFIWLGKCEDGLRLWLDIDMQAGPLAGRFHLLPFDADVGLYLNGADVFALTSREDPFPSVVLEALACGVPVVAFEGGGAYVDAIKAVPHGGSIVPMGDVAAMAGAALRLLAEDREALAPARASAAAERYDWREYVFGLLELAMPDLKRVSVVVPNYNYARHLPTRLNSIFEQDYPLYEVVLLDDCSADESIEVAQAVAAHARRSLVIRANEVNTGAAIRQWEKAIRLARGEYLWIAEADDICTPNFVSDLLGKFTHGTTLGFCDSIQVDSSGRRVGESYGFYFEDLPWNPLVADFRVDGQKFVSEVLAIKNVILNASAVLFRRDALLQTLERSRTEILDFKVAGDWRIYCEMLLSDGAEVVYRHRANNVHRRHQASVTHSLDAPRHLEEIARVQQYVATACRTSEPVAQARSAYLGAVTGNLLASAKMAAATTKPKEREPLALARSTDPPEESDG